MSHTSALRGAVRNSEASGKVYERTHALVASYQASSESNQNRLPKGAFELKVFGIGVKEIRSQIPQTLL